jgi:hypothetical protein
MDTLWGAFKSRTVWFGLLVLVLTWAQSVISDSGLTSDQVHWVGSLLSAAIVALRSVTTGSLADKTGSGQ